LRTISAESVECARLYESFEHLFIGGLKEEEYPKTLSDNPLFGDREKTFLRKSLKNNKKANRL